MTKVHIIMLCELSEKNNFDGQVKREIFKSIAMLILRRELLCCI